jgi:putative DNA primase/helicase
MNKNVPPPKSNQLVTEDGAAIEFARIYGNRLRYDCDSGHWREWTGSIWKQTKIPT